jgi:hypothetical protein
VDLDLDLDVDMDFYEYAARSIKVTKQVRDKVRRAIEREVANQNATLGAKAVEAFADASVRYHWASTKAAEARENVTRERELMRKRYAFAEGILAKIADLRSVCGKQERNLFELHVCLNQAESHIRLARREFPVFNDREEQRLRRGRPGNLERDLLLTILCEICCTCLRFPNPETKMGVTAAADFVAEILPALEHQSTRCTRGRRGRREKAKLLREKALSGKRIRHIYSRTKENLPSLKRQRKKKEQMAVESEQEYERLFGMKPRGAAPVLSYDDPLRLLDDLAGVSSLHT